MFASMPKRISAGLPNPGKHDLTRIDTSRLETMDFSPETTSKPDREPPTAVSQDLSKP